MYPFEIFYVGGVIRDTLLSLPIHDIDYVVVGATEEDMITAGFKHIEATSFPVFHCQDGSEYALARTEKKIGGGYHGFETDHNSTITLVDDLKRRDLSINSLAVAQKDWEEFVKTKNHKLVIDPYGGIQDLKDKILRQTSEAFIEDPLRVLRTARFAARYEFDIHPDTLTTMRNIVDDGELNALPMERVFVEFKKAMMEDRPDIFFDVLNDVDALNLYFDELWDWKNVPLKKAIKHNATFEERVCLLLFGLSVPEAVALLMRIKAPTDLMNKVLWTAHMEELIDDIDFGCVDEPFTNKYLWERLNRINAWQNLEKIKAIFNVFVYIGISTKLDTILAAVVIGTGVGFDDLDEDTRDQLVGKEIGEAISQKRLEVLEEVNFFPS